LELSARSENNWLFVETKTSWTNQSRNIYFGESRCLNKVITVSLVLVGESRTWTKSRWYHIYIEVNKQEYCILFRKFRKHCNVVFIVISNVLLFQNIVELNAVKGQRCFYYSFNIGSTSEFEIRRWGHCWIALSENCRTELLVLWDAKRILFYKKSRPTICLSDSIVVTRKSDLHITVGKLGRIYIVEDVVFWHCFPTCFVSLSLSIFILFAYRNQFRPFLYSIFLLFSCHSLFSVLSLILCRCPEIEM